MSERIEYVCEVAPDEYGELTEVRGLHEPVVRCRDCKFMDAIQEDGQVCSTDPDGFCKWGVRCDG